MLLLLLECGMSHSSKTVFFAGGVILGSCESFGRCDIEGACLGIYSLLQHSFFLLPALLRRKHSLAICSYHQGHGPFLLPWLPAMMDWLFPFKMVVTISLLKLFLSCVLLQQQVRHEQETNVWAKSAGILSTQQENWIKASSLCFEILKTPECSRKEKCVTIGNTLEGLAWAFPCLRHSHRFSFWWKWGSF